MAQFCSCNFFLILNRTGGLRFQLPQQFPPYGTSFSATEYGPACPQQPIVQVALSELLTEMANDLLHGTLTSAEDCRLISFLV